MVFNSTDNILKDMRDVLKKLVATQNEISKSLKKLESKDPQDRISPMNDDNTIKVPVNLDWSEADYISGFARITDDGYLVSIQVMLDPEESQKVREVMAIAPVEGLRVSSVAIR